jgi:hypothetical protein
MDIQNRLHKIMWDRRYVFIPKEIECPKGLDSIILRDAKLVDRNYYLFVREREEFVGRQEEVPTEGDIFASARQGGYWTEQDDLVLKEADSHIEYLKTEASRKGFAARKRQIEAQIEATKEEKAMVLEKERELKFQTIEYHSHAAAATALLYRLVDDVNGNPLWSSENDFVEFRDRYPALIMFLLHEMLSEGMLEIKEIRELARSPEWRLLWTLNRENLSSLFGRPVSDINLNQKLLIYWSRVYDSALEGVKPPDQETVEDDDKFDKWLANRDLEKDEEVLAEKRPNSALHHQEQYVVLDGTYVESCSCGVGTQKGVPHGLRKPHDNSCLYGTWRDYSQQEKDEIAAGMYSRNNTHMRRYMDKEQSRVQRRGVVKEQDLRDKTSRKILGANTNVIQKGNR